MTPPLPAAGLATINHWISGKAWTAPAERWGDVYNPAHGEPSARVAFADSAVVDAAVASATEAARAWGRTSLAARARVLFAFRELVERRKRDLAAILTREHGKVLSDALGEVNRGLEVVEFACGLPHLLKGEFSENVSTDVDSYSIRQPLGVVAGITPFNFPAMVPMWMYPLAIACGNAFILKPSEKDPSAAMFSAELLAEAGLPPGVFTIVHGDKAAVDAILSHPGIQAVSFVGSTPIARYIYETGTRHGKRVQALGGAKNHMIVLTRRRPRSGGRFCSQRRVWFDRPALYGHLCARRGRRRRRSPAASGARAAAEAERHGRPRTRRRHGSTCHP